MRLLHLKMFGQVKNNEKSFHLLRAGFEPATYGFLLCFQLQCTALPTMRAWVQIPHLTQLFATLTVTGVTPI